MADLLANSATVTDGDTILDDHQNNLRLDILEQAGEYRDSTGAADAYVVADDAQVASLQEGQIVIFNANFTNAGAITINYGGFGAKPGKKHNDQALVAGDIESGQITAWRYDGTNMQMLTPTGIDGKNLTLKTGTFGETIDGTTTPVLVYLKAADGKWYKSDADATESTYKTEGFAINSGNDTDIALIVTGGILGGFAGMTETADQFVSGTAGERTETPGTNKHKIGVAWSATEIKIELGNKMMAGVLTDLDTVNNANNDQIITIGFRAKIIELDFYIQGHDSAVATAHFYVSVGRGTWEETTLISWFGFANQSNQGGAGDDQEPQVLSFLDASIETAPAAGTSGGNASEKKVTISIPTVTDTTFVVRQATAGGADPGSQCRSRIAWRVRGY